MITGGEQIPRSKQLLISILLIICGALVFIFGTNYYSIFSTNDSQIYRVILGVIFLGAALILRRKESLEIFSQIAFAFFIGISVYFVTSLTAVMRDDLLRSFAVPAGNQRHLALIKLFEAILVVALILILNKLWGNDLKSLYIKRGRLGLALFIGGCMLLINAATGIVTGAAMGHVGEQLIAKLPWVLLFSLSNGFMEELLFRGIFLRKFAKVIGVVGSIIVTSIVFTVMHSAATYMNPVETVLFQVIIFPMALLFAYLMHKTDSIWGSALFHAGSDVFLFYLMAF
jgi:membrane protease YdiL (CAAX protease family)